MEFGFKIITAVLGASGIFASAGVLELIKKLLQEWRSRRVRAHVMREEEEETWAITFPEDPKLSPKPEVTKPLGEPVTYEIPIPGDRDVLGKARAGRRVRPTARESTSKFGPFIALLLVVCVFAISIGVIWALTHIGGPIEAGVKTTIEKAGGSILIVGTGLFGAFFAVALMAFAAIRVFSGSFDR
jgi:hypothetical protein